MSSLPAQPDPRADQATVQLLNQREDIERVQNTIVQIIENHGFPKAAIFAIRLALHEAITNAFGHGHKNLAPSVPIHVGYAVDSKTVHLTVEDQGPGFEPGDVPDPTLDENLEVPSGRGLMLMRAYMTSVQYSNHGRRLTLMYAKPDPQA